MDIDSNPKYRRINQDIAEGRFYDSLQHVLSASKRAIISKKYYEAFYVLRHFAGVYIGVKEYAQSLELMKEYINIAKQGSISLTTEHVEQINTFFNAVTTALSVEEPSGPLTKEKIVEGALAIMEDALELIPDKTLYKTLGQYYINERDLAVAQRYLVHTQDVEAIYDMLEKWCSHVEEHERGFIYLRCILIQLALGDSTSAKCLLLMLNLDFESGEGVPLPIQLAHILTEICEEPDFQLFKVTCKVYKTIIEADPNFIRLILAIRQRIFPGHNDPTDPFNINASPSPMEGNPFAALLGPFMQNFGPIS
ncbi:uncharacterized protein BBOV_IV001620 [Babesia bovis T2Bo]|uniref:uncharacterized protein n=1 Tax=Babesia bovis T2Bo TaxID=484906 RepID=UPI001D49E89C|nr:uncharacterized protein BBOV_IV001620 [Babesia bovis T2Bo]EDO05759.2 hypothetical protein BBOV_IV001620 [Babesia bovis T2Bo]